MYIYMYLYDHGLSDIGGEVSLHSLVELQKSLEATPRGQFQNQSEGIEDDPLQSHNVLVSQGGEERQLLFQVRKTG